MAWVRLDDSFADHPKIVAAGPIAALIHVRALCYASRHLTDGFIPLDALPTLTCGLEHISIEYATVGDGAGTELAGFLDKATDCDWAKALVRQQLWESRDGGYQIHDYLEYNPSRAEILKLRRMKVKAGRAGGQASAQARAQAPAWPSGSEVLNSPSPSPSPSPKKEKKEKDTVSLRETARTVLQFLNEKTGKSFRPTDTNLGFVLARLRTGATEQDCRAVIARKVRQWKGDPKMHEFLRPKTLFNATNFESYLGEAAPEPPGPQP